MSQQTGLSAMSTGFDEKTDLGKTSGSVHCEMPRVVESIAGLIPFAEKLGENGLRLEKERVRTLQLNVGLVCNQTCVHCHHDAGPHRSEYMGKDTIDAALEYADRANFGCVEITGGAPELNPHIGYIIEKLAAQKRKVSLRTNLTALSVRKSDEIVELCIEHKVAIVASLPSVNAIETDAQRGEKVFEKSVEALKMLNNLGYGKENTSLELSLVVNPNGPLLSPAQQVVEMGFRELLLKKWRVTFNQLYTLGNVPLGRFGAYLTKKGIMETYLLRLSAHFNPVTITGLMCRTLVCVSWDGYLYDCDFNIAAGLPLGGSKIHVSRIADLPQAGTVIPTGSHCYACAAGAGFT